MELDPLDAVTERFACRSDQLGLAPAVRKCNKLLTGPVSMQ